MESLVIGCGNPLRGDDGAGPALVRRLERLGLPAGVRCVDAGTAGIDAVFLMRGFGEVLLVDACRSGSVPGTLHALPPRMVDEFRAPESINFHTFRWDQAVACARRLLGDDRPARIGVRLVEAEAFEPGTGLSPAVDRAVDRLAERLCADAWSGRGLLPHDQTHPGPDAPLPRPGAAAPR